MGRSPRAGRPRASREVSGRCCLTLVAVLAVSEDTLAQSKPKFCTIPSEFENRVHLYEGCIAAKASEFEIAGDTAESVAVAAVGACDDCQRRVEDYIDVCYGPKGIGRSALEQSKKRFQDYAVQAVIEFRSARLRKRP